MKIRLYHEKDAPILMTIFKSAVRENAKGFYSEDQLLAWAPESMNLEFWKERMLSINPFVLIDNNQILAYADLQPNGYIDHFFVKGGQANKGYGQILMDYLIKEAIRRKLPTMTADVSLAAQAFFSKHGFEIIKSKKVKIRGQVLENALMRKTLIQ